jgi:GDP-D-mannose dehydratase
MIGVSHLVGDSSKTRAELGWKRDVSLCELVELMAG